MPSTEEGEKNRIVEFTVGRFVPLTLVGSLLQISGSSLDWWELRKDEKVVVVSKNGIIFLDPLS